MKGGSKVTLSGCYFTYNNIPSGTYGLFFGEKDTQADMNIGGNLDYTIFKSNNSPKNTIINRRYEEPLSFDVEMFTETHMNDITFEEIVMWLSNTYNYGKLQINNNSYYGYHFNCYFTNIEKIIGGNNGMFGRFGIRAKMICDSSFMWSDDLIEVTYTKAELTQIATHINESMQRGYIYPTLILKTGTVGGNVIVQNTTDNNRLVMLDGLHANETITMTSNPFEIKSTLRNNVYANLVNKNWFRLVNGQNRIGIVGDIAQITIKYEKAKVVI